MDLEVGSDIIKTILTPTVPELLVLAIIVAIRIVLSWSLSKDMQSYLVTNKKTENDSKLL